MFVSMYPWTFSISHCFKLLYLIITAFLFYIVAQIEREREREGERKREREREREERERERERVLFWALCLSWKSLTYQ